MSAMDSLISFGIDSCRGSLVKCRRGFINRHGRRSASRKPMKRSTNRITRISGAPGREIADHGLRTAACARDLRLVQPSLANRVDDGLPVAHGCRSYRFSDFYGIGKSASQWGNRLAYKHE